MAGQPRVDRVAALDAATERARTATREANEATAGLRTALHEAEAMLTRMREGIAATIRAEVTRQVDEMGEKVGQAQREAVQQVFDEFDRLMASLMGPDDGPGSMEEVARRFRARINLIETRAARPAVTTVTLDEAAGDLL